LQKELEIKENKKFLLNIIVPVFNAEKYLEKCLNSILKQSYKNFRVKVIDDCSTDSSFELAAAICSNYDNFHLKKNSRRLGALNNIYEMLSVNIKEPSKTIDILVDGDDYLYSGDVFNIIYEKYLNTNCLITYGSHLSSKGVQGKKYPRFIKEFNLYRKYFWYASHLKTFRHDLWLSINQNDFLDQNGQYFSVASDLALMFPMLEMAGNRQEFVKDLLYVYNDQNPISDHKIRRKEQILAAKEIRNKNRYSTKNFI
tara:strand:+ start:1873 stop:2640 length:768 start_codon:yes stop_codon:yes gene_type:complete